MLPQRQIKTPETPSKEPHLERLRPFGLFESDERRALAEEEGALDQIAVRLKAGEGCLLAELGERILQPGITIVQAGGVEEAGHFAIAGHAHAGEFRWRGRILPDGALHVGDAFGVLFSHFFATCRSYC